MKKTKVAIIHNIIAPYRFPLFNELSKYQDLDVTVLFMTEGSRNRKWNVEKYKSQMNFKCKILPSFKFKLPISDYTEYIVNPTIFSEFRNYDVVITAGWLDFSCQMTYLFSRIYGFKYIIWSESTDCEKSWQRTISKPYVKWAVQNASGLIAIGSRSKDYLIQLGAKPDKVSIAYSTVDIDHFKKESNLTALQRSDLRNKLYIPNNHKIILYVGQFIHRKGVDILLEAFSKLKGDESLLLIGYGPELQSYKSFIKHNNLMNVIILPHVEVHEMPKYYGIADIFILPSREETWGLVINEAMASGLPIITTDKVGSGKDLVSVGQNGYIYKSNNSHLLASKIRLILNDNNIQGSFSKNSSKLINNFSPAKTAKSFHELITSVVK